MKICTFTERDCINKNELQFQKVSLTSLPLCFSTNWFNFDHFRRFISQAHYSLCFTLSIPKKQSAWDSAPSVSAGGNIKTLYKREAESFISK